MLICLTANHKNASFDLLERLAVDPGTIAQRITGHDESLAGAVVVATCNRFEAYIDVDEPAAGFEQRALEATVDAIRRSTDLESAELTGTLDMHVGRGAAEHLFAVAAGLESVVVGEGEIAGQVRRALERARAAGTTSSDLERAFQRASQTSRGVKNSTPIGRAGRSLVRLALDLAESRVEDWSGVRVLLVGTGAYAGASLAAIADRGATDIGVYSPSGRGERFAARHGIRLVEHADFAREAATAGLVVTCTTASGSVLDADILEAGRREMGAVHPHASTATAAVTIVDENTDETLAAVVVDAEAAAAPRHLAPSHEAAHALPAARLDAEECPVPTGRKLVIDLGLPRNVDPSVATVHGVELLDLETIRIHAPLEELQATDDARRIVSRAAEKYTTVSDEITLTPAVVALRQHVFGILDAEIDRARSRGDDDGRTEQALRHLAGVLLHTPMVRARDAAHAGDHERYVDALDALFGIDASLSLENRPASATDTADETA
ncbi:glutamyl-tRNA reductase [Labedella gwakjiensis]|uniref:Glutamyl-tRNA reductase n=1 Tax=Labedella gwakjiensis TaxID=390269 RepID=A0A2P8GVS3_9MICO|nr:glutamyl-tRNA reductase [Labedella gwakjiensis]PSL38071.1 glutamyl-tRNA reductase [Labedella gwakjiensis]RUQ87371.1 glutamyl-tRNA reductase [Labedella gwakjiensis]